MLTKSLNSWITVSVSLTILTAVWLLELNWVGWKVVGYGQVTNRLID